MNKGHTYRVSLTPVDDHGQPTDRLSAVEFIHRNHDDLARIVGLVRASSGLDAESSAALAVGLKLLGERVLQHRSNPLLEGLRTPLRDLILALKSRRGA
jgi:Domain of Unknown Function with PDB structure (DUF3861)